MILIATTDNKGENEEIEFLEITKGKEYEVHADQHGLYLFDDVSDEHYIEEFDWRKVFSVKA